MPPRSSFVVFAFPHSRGVRSSACRGACDLLHWPYLSSAIIAPHTCVRSSGGVASMCFHTHTLLLGNHFILAQVCQSRCRHAGDVHTKGMQHHNFVSVTESGYVCVKIFSKTSALLDLYQNKTILSRDGSCLLYTSPSPRDGLKSRMPSSA